MDAGTYIKQVLTEHLLANEFKQLSSESAKQKMENIKLTLSNISPEKLTRHFNKSSSHTTARFQHKSTKQ